MRIKVVRARPGNRTNIINSIAEVMRYQSYLEIGVYDSMNNFNRILVPHKVGVDPHPVRKFHGYMMTSNEFFAINKEKFDLIFVDGKHTYEQCKTDIEESLKILNDNGTIIVHDTYFLKRCYEVPIVHGKCWRVIAEMRQERPELWIGTIFDDDGCTIIRRGSQQLYPKVQMSWVWYRDYKEDLMNKVTLEEVIDKLRIERNVN